MCASLDTGHDIDGKQTCRLPRASPALPRRSTPASESFAHLTRSRGDSRASAQRNQHQTGCQPRHYAVFISDGSIGSTQIGFQACHRLLGA